MKTSAEVLPCLFLMSSECFIIINKFVVFATKILILQIMENSVKTLFTDREREIADLMARGLSEKEIAEHLNRSPATANNHTRNMREKLHVNKNTELILAYIADVNHKKFSISEIRQFGVSIILILINICLFNKEI